MTHPKLTHDVIEAAMRRARQERAEAIGAMLRRAFSGLRRLAVVLAPRHHAGPAVAAQPARG